MGFCERISVEQLPERAELSDIELFSKLAPGDTGITFKSELDLNHQLKRLYQSGFACGGVAIGDLNGDGVVNGMDMTILLSAWGTAGPGDFNGDGVVNGADLAILLSAWGP